MTSQLIAPENVRVCSVSGFFALLLALAYPQGSICHAKFHFDWFKVSPLRGEMLKNRPVSKNNTALHFAQRWR